jgi:hypothetical protein
MQLSSVIVEVSAIALNVSLNARGIILVPTFVLRLG